MLAKLDLAARTVTDAAPGLLPAVIVPDALVADFPGPAICCDERGRARAANPLAAPIAGALERNLDPALAALVASVAQSGASAAHRWRLPDAKETRIFDLTLMPVGIAGEPGTYVLVLGRDGSMEHNLLNALAESRQRYRDIVACSGGFAWETDGDGVFRFVSPNGALGYAAAALNGRRARDLLDPSAVHAGPLPFESPDAIVDAEAWLRRADGAPARMLVSSTPRLGPGGRFLGARGLCHDVTLVREREAALARARVRETLARNIVDSIRNQLAPEDMFRAAARSTEEALKARHCWILRAAPGRALFPAVEGDAGALPAALSRRLRAIVRQAADGEVQAFTCAGLSVLATVCGHGQTANGVFCVARGHADGGWDEDARALLASVAGHIGIAVAQAEIQEKLTELSRTDALTGLLNRRAFGEEVDRRLSHLRRYGRPGVLLYCDLDNFKQVNDAFGHATGDRLLHDFADILRNGSRPGDLAARLGGDEFALWLEETDLAGGEAKASRLREAADALRAHSRPGDPPVSVSIGVTLADPARRPRLEGLLAMADEAMYRAKQAGRNAAAEANRTGADA